MGDEIASLLKGELPEEGLRRDKLERIVNQLRAIANVDIRHMIGEDGTMTNANDWPDELALAISAINMHHAGGYNVRFYDKLRAADLLTKYESLLTEDDAPTSPLDAAFEKIPRAKLHEMKRHLDRMAEDAAKALEAQE